MGVVDRNVSNVRLAMSRYSLNWVLSTWTFTTPLLLYMIGDRHNLVIKDNGKINTRVSGHGIYNFPIMKRVENE